MEDNVKHTTRRLSKSHEDEVNLNDTVLTEMFKEQSSISPPFHGFTVGDHSTEMVEPSQVLKRVHSNTGTGLEMPKKRFRSCNWVKDYH